MSDVPAPHPGGPLSGYRVVEFADEKGQLCGRLLADLGADVIKVEPRGGEPSRDRGPFYRDEPGSESSLFWWAMNGGKRSVTCELRLDAGREIARKLVLTADLVIETFPPGDAARVGLDYATLAALDPALVVVSVTNFGQTGPYRAFLADDTTASAMGGQMGLDCSGSGPLRTTAPLAVAQVNVQAAFAAAAALYARGGNGGLGQHVDVSLQEAVAAVAGPALAASASPRPLVVEARDGWVVLDEPALATPVARTALAAWIRAPDADGALLAESFSRFCRTQPRAALDEGAARRGIPLVPVCEPRDRLDAPPGIDAVPWLRVPHDDLGESFLYPGAPFTLAETPWQQRGRAPRLGEHNEAVYGDLLGLDAKAVRMLKLRMVL